MIGQTVSHYRILEKLGQGGMGVVYLAEDTHLGRQVAVKFLPASNSETHHFKARFLREARAASALSHPNIATIYDYGETPEGAPFIVMECIRGKALDEMLRDDEMTLRRALEIAEDVADALSEAHAHGIVHRDIKPSNVFISDRGQVKVLDFGLAKLIHEEFQQVDPDARTLLATNTRTDIVVGTPLYLSPEQAMSAPVDGRSDIFALGALLYECVAGRPAFSGGNVLEIAGQVLHVDPPAPSSVNPRVPQTVDRIIMKALSKRPEERYQDAGEMAEELRAAQEGVAGETHRIKRIRDDLHRTAAPGKRATNHSGAFSTITEGLKRRRVPLGYVLLSFLVAGLALAAVLYWWRPGTHKVSAEAQSWYDRGVTALRNGAYFQATKSLAKAVEVDGRFALAHARLAEAWMEMGYTDNAKDEMLRVSSLVPDRSVLERPDALSLEAINALVSNDFTRAVKAYEELQRLQPDSPQVYVDLGRAYERMEELAKATDSYVQATNRDAQNALAYLRLGALYGRQQNMAAALQSFDKAKGVYEPAGDIEGQASVLFERGYLLLGARRLDEARENLRQALELASASGNDSQRINALLQLSRLSYTEGATDKAQSYANEAISFAQQRGLDEPIALGLNSLGYTFYFSGKYEEAEGYYRRGLEFAKRSKSRLREAVILQNLGSLYIRQLRTDEGLAMARQALAFFEQGEYRYNIHVCLTVIGRANRQKGDYQEALNTFQRSLKLAEESSYPAQVAFSRGEIATVLAEQERYPEALGLYDQSLETHKSLNDRRSMAYSLINHGRLLWRLGRYDESRNALAEAESLASRPDNTVSLILAEVPVHYAQIALSERRFPEARAKALQSMGLAGRQYEDVRIQALYTLGLAQALSGSAAEGRKSCEEAVGLAQSGGDAGLLWRARLALAEVLLENKDSQAASNLAVQAAENFGRAGQLESEWRAWAIAARASRLKGEDGAASDQQARAEKALSELRERWGQEVFGRYMTRPDVQVLHKGLGGAVPAAEK